MRWFCVSMQEALQPRPQRPQLVHFDRSMVGRNSEKWLTRLRVVPTGQMVLQYSRPQSQAQQKITTSVTRPVMSRAGTTEPEAAPKTLRTMRP